MVENHHLLHNGLLEPPHRRGSPPVAWWLIALGVSETRGHQLNISLGFISISISHSVRRSQKSINMSATNDYKGQNSSRSRVSLAAKAIFRVITDLYAIALYSSD
jgi:hypothetical protein